MKQLRIKQLAIVLVLAIIPSLAVIRWHSQSSVPFCIQSAGCDSNKRPLGTITNQTYGYPLAYRQTSTFVPDHRDQNKPDYAGYSSAQVEHEKFSLPGVIINIIFWFALLQLAVGWLIARLIDRTKDRSTSHAPLDDRPSSTPVASPNPAATSSTPLDKPKM